jgi:predicted glycosyltransferase
MTDTSLSLLTRFYYSVKPFVPKSLRWALRRRLASDIRSRNADVWPINEAAGEIPAGWPGWPEGKRFALVLTHDVEGQVGVDKVRALAEIEMKFGCRSCFNFIPEGEYRVPDSLREWLIERGFEVGVHDLNHDGKLYQSRTGFAPKAKRINHYLREWSATGFRSGFMLRKLEWLHDLDIEYECSTFDTDPFEPQPAGAHTIFPYWIPRPNGCGAPGGREGYVELPYTLPQDSTMFLLLREADAGIWERKTDWIVRRGGMVLMNVHPDYIDLEGGGDDMTYPLSHYSDFLKWFMAQYRQDVWQALPREISQFVLNHRPDSQECDARWPALVSADQSHGIKIWIDLENTPHIPFFRPIIRELRKQGHQVVLTARDGYQTCEMAGFHSLEYQKVGHHYGKRTVAKAWGLLARSCQLMGFARHERPGLALNLGSRSQNLAAKLMGIPVVEIMDYEHTAESRLLESRWYLTPETVCSDVYDGKTTHRVRTYEGIKEDVYVPDFQPDGMIVDQLGLRDAEVVVTARPPATEAHYHNPEAEVLFARFMERALECPGAKVVLLPRNKRQEGELRSRHPQWFESSKVVIPECVVDGLNLIWHSDLVVSGGGTMNREAAAMAVPVYSVFRGPVGAVDRLLCDQKRLTLIESCDDVDQKIQLVPRLRGHMPDSTGSGALADILGHLAAIIASLRKKPEGTSA